MKRIFASMVCSLLLSQTGFAHEGHAVPGSIPSAHGGTALGGKEINLEYVITGSDLKLYPMSHEGKDLGSSQVKVNATAKAPKEKSEKLNLQFKDGSFMAHVDFKKAYRLEVNVTTESNGKKDTFKFQMEK
jgi:hypothetical protein